MKYVHVTECAPDPKDDIHSIARYTDDGPEKLTDAETTAAVVKLNQRTDLKAQIGRLLAQKHDANACSLEYEEQQEEAAAAVDRLGATVLEFGKAYEQSLADVNKLKELVKIRDLELRNEKEAAIQQRQSMNVVIAERDGALARVRAVGAELKALEETVSTLQGKMTLHPDGRCSCYGGGQCDWCRRMHAEMELEEHKEEKSK